MNQAVYDIILINPFDQFFHSVKAQRVPMGLLMLGGVLEKSGYRVKIIDCYAEKLEQQELISILKETSCSLFGVTGTTNTRAESFELAKTIKNSVHNATVIYGGVNATFTWREILEGIDVIDIVAIGEGEETIVELLSVLRKKEGHLREVRGIAYRENGDIKKNDDRPLIHDLDNLPYPAYHLINMESYDFDLPYVNKKAGIILSSRGCPAKCDFCSTGMMWGIKFRFKSPKAIVDEVEFLMKHHHVEGIKFIDDAMTWNKRHLDKILDEFKSRKIAIPWVCESRVSSLTKEILIKMKEAGCIRVGLGVESGSDRILKRIRKGTNRENVTKVINWCAEIGMKVKAYFIVGHPEETLEEAKETIKWMAWLREKGCYTTVSYGTVIFPGTLVEKFAKEQNLMPENFSWVSPYNDEHNAQLLGQDPRSPVLFQKQLNVKDLEGMKYELIKSNIFEISFFRYRILPRLTSVKGILHLVEASLRHLKVFLKLKRL